MFRKKPQPPVENVEWMIVGLGNPGAEYRGTRHNVGFAVVELLADRHKLKIARGRNKAMLGIGPIAGHSVALVKPLTYMNLSGQAVGPLARSFNLKPSHVLVIADDLDLPLGKLRLRAKGSPGGHNGHKSLMAFLQTNEYPRIKIGIDCVDKGRTIDHVLSTFDRDERETIDAAIRHAAEVSEAVVNGNWEEGLRLVEAHNKLS